MCDQGGDRLGVKSVKSRGGPVKTTSLLRVATTGSVKVGALNRFPWHDSQYAWVAPGTGERMPQVLIHRVGGGT